MATNLRPTWNMRTKDDDYKLENVYDTYKELFTIHFHYDGKFVQNPNKEYVDGKVGTFDFIEHETFSMHEFDAIITELECENGSMYRHFMIPETCLDNGLRPIKTDKDISKMLSYVPAFQEINVYLTTVDEEEYFRSTGELIDEIDAELNLVDFKTSNKYNVATSSEPVRGFVGEQSKPPVKDNNEPFLDEDIEDSETRQEENDSENEEDSDGRTEVDDSQDDDFDPLKEIDFDEFGDDGDDGNEKGNVALEVDPADEFEVDMSKFNFNFEVEGGNVKDFTPKIGELEVNEEVIAIDFDDFESGPDVNSEGERRMKLKHLRRNMGKDSDLVVKNRFYVGQVFGSKKPVKQMLKEHAIETRRDIKMVKDDKVRLRARCFGQVPEPKPRYTKSKVALEKEILASPEKAKDILGSPDKPKYTKAKVTMEKEILASPEKAKGVNSQEVKGKGVVGDIKGKGVVGDTSEKNRLKKPTCPWTLHVSKGKGEDRWMVKTLILEHKCLQLRHLRQCTSTFISQQILDTVDADPRIKGAAIQDIVSKRFELGIKRMTAVKAKAKAKKLLAGDYNQQYERLRDYCLELQKRNPNTTVKIDVHIEPNPNCETRVFKRIYICLGPLKEGFKACRRDLLGLDGAFMRGPYPGQVLTAVGVDPNNGIYPLAYGVVEAETFDSWRWFITCLQDDLELPTNANFTFISDRQKGLIPALARVFPSAEHRFCLRHIYENMSKTFKGEVIRELLWKCATRTTVMEFDAAMEELKVENAGAYNYLKEIPPKHWSRSHFSGRSNCDILLNNICESFNSRLVEGRDKPIISCLEYIREYLMKRIVIVQKVIDAQQGPLTPAATILFEAIKKGASKCNAIWNGRDRFQVKDSYREQCVVDIRERTCSCRRWQLTGMPCKHAVCGIWDAANNSINVGIVEDWVHPCYRLDTWKTVYDFKVEPVSGSASWPKSECPTRLLPPLHKNQIGRPKKQRQKSTMEIEAAKMVKEGRLSRAGKSITCGKCGNKGHNSRNCKGQGGASTGGARKSAARKSGPSGASQVGASQPGASQGGESEAGASQGVKRTMASESGASPSGASPSAKRRKKTMATRASASQVQRSQSQTCATQPLGTQ